MRHWLSLILQICFFRLNYCENYDCQRCPLCQDLIDTFFQKEGFRLCEHFYLIYVECRCYMPIRACSIDTILSPGNFFDTFVSSFIENNDILKERSISLLEPITANGYIQKIYEKFKNDVQKLHCEDLFQYDQYQNDHMRVNDIILNKDRSLKLAWRPKHTILLTVEDFYQTNYMLVRNSNYSYAGDIVIPDETKMCQNIIKIRYDDMSSVETCENASATYVKLVDNNLFIEYPKLYDFVTDFNLSKTSLINTFCYKPKAQYKPKVIICGEHVNKDILKSLRDRSDNLEINYVYNCPDTRNCTLPENEEALAILTPRPYNFLGTSKTPTIFYDKVRLFQDTTDIFSNAIPGFSSGNIEMKNAFVEFIKKMGWTRVAIVSDFSEESMEFEHSLTPLLDKESIHYVTAITNVRDFSNVIKSLEKPKIVILNIKEEYAMAVTKQLNSVKRIVWVARAWSRIATQEAVKKLNYADFFFSITIGPPIGPPIRYDLEQIDESLLNTKLLILLEIISNKARFFKINPKWKKPRYFADSMHQSLKSIAIEAYIIRTYKNNMGVHRKLIAEIIPTDTSKSYNYITLEQFLISSSPTNLPLDGCATFRENTYEMKCNDKEFIFIMLVICIFVLLVLVIMRFYDQTDGQYSRMEC